MTDDDLLNELAGAAPLDGADFTRGVLRRARLPARRRRGHRIYLAASAAIAVAVLGAAVVGPIGPAVAAVAAITWALGTLGG